MKRFHLLPVVTLSLLLLTCEKYEFTNPYDSKVAISPPTGLSATQQGEWLRLSWTGNAQIRTGYEIERKSGSADFSLLCVLSDPIQTSFIDSTLTTNTTYLYQLRGFSDQNKSEYSSPVTAKADFPAPTNLNYTVLSDTSLQLTWQHNCAFETSYEIDHQTSGGDWQTVRTTSANVLTFTDNGLVYRQNYNYRMRATTRKNQTDYVDRNNLNTIFPAPANLAANPLNDCEIKLTWQHNCAYEKGFIIARKQDGFDWQQVGQTAADVLEFLNTGLSLNVNYSYRIKAFTAKSQSDYSNEATKSTVFPAPTSLTATPMTDAQIRLDWVDNCSFEADYRIERNAGNGYTQICEVTANEIIYTDENANLGALYS